MIGKKNPFSYNNTRSNKDLNSLFKIGLGIISNIEKTRKANKKEESRLDKQKIAYQKSLLSLEKNKIKQEELSRELDLLKKGFLKRKIDSLHKYAEYSLLSENIINDIGNQIKLGKKYVFIHSYEINEIQKKYKQLNNKNK